MSECTRHIQPISETAVAITFSGAGGPEMQQKVLAVAEFLLQNPFPGMLAVVPAYASVTVFFDLFLWSKQPVGPPGLLPHRGFTPLNLPFAFCHLPFAPYPTAARALCLFLEKTLPEIPLSISTPSPLVDIPVRYGGIYGPDLLEVAERLQRTENEVVSLHTAAEYTVLMVGFLPGFPYLGPLPEALHLPRRDTPRLRVPPGSVAIAGGQTGIYPQASPGGWHLIGHTDFRLFDPNERPPARLHPGQRVRFVAG